MAFERQKLNRPARRASLPASVGAPAQPDSPPRTPLENADSAAGEGSGRGGRKHELEMTGTSSPSRVGPGPGVGGWRRGSGGKRGRAQRGLRPTPRGGPPGAPPLPSRPPSWAPPSPPQTLVYRGAWEWTGRSGDPRPSAPSSGRAGAGASCVQEGAHFRGRMHPLALDRHCLSGEACRVPSVVLHGLS